MTAQDYVNSLDNPIVFYASVGTPSGDRIAAFDDTEFPFDLSDLEGAIVDDVGGKWWAWNGEGDPLDFNGNTVTLVKVYDDAEEWEKQLADYEAQV